MDSIETRLYNGYKQYNTGSGWKFTHRRVAEKTLGKAIPADHEVHHINKNINDNRPENLTILTKEEHRAIHKNTSNYENKIFTSIIDGIYSSIFIQAYNNLMNKFSIQIELNVKEQEVELINKRISMVNEAKKVIENFEGAEKTCAKDLNCSVLYNELEDIFLEIEILESKLNNF